MSIEKEKKFLAELNALLVKENAGILIQNGELVFFFPEVTTLRGKILQEKSVHKFGGTGVTGNMRFGQPSEHPLVWISPTQEAL